jgi:hypothetical protein
MKTCPCCEITKNLDSFSKNKSRKDGLNVYCKSCYKLKMDAWISKNKDKYNSIQKMSKKRNRVKINQSSLKKYHENKKDEIYLKKLKEYSKKSRQKRKTKINENNKKYYHYKYNNDINYKIRILLRGRFQKAVSRNSKQTSVLNLIGCTIEELKIYISKKFLVDMSWENYGKWHIDHIKPCSSFDLTKLSEQQKCFHYSNLQPLWAKDNIKKSNKLS